MPGRNKLLKQCESLTRGSKFTKRCQAKGKLKKSGHYRCRFHAGESEGPVTIEGMIKSLQNLPQYKNKTEEELKDVIRKTGKYYRKT